MGFINKIFGTHSQHELKRIKPIVDKILGMREQWVALSDEELQHKTVEFKERLAKGETLMISFRKPSLQFVRPPEECWARSIIRFS